MEKSIISRGLQSNKYGIRTSRGKLQLGNLHHQKFKLRRENAEQQSTRNLVTCSF